MSATSSNVTCNGGTNGSVTLNVSGGTAPISYVWSNGSTTQNISGVKAGQYSVVAIDGNGCVGTANGFVNQPNPFQVSILRTNVSCFGTSDGSISLSVTGGTPGYTYSWSNGGASTASRTGLAAGAYTVTITDALSCTAVRAVLLTQPSSLQASVVASNIKCFGGSSGQITLTSSGGTSPYTYAWTGPGGFTATTKDISGLIVGSYNVTVTDSKGCTKTVLNTTLTQPALLAVSSAIPTNVSCYGGSNGSIDATVVGGTLPYSYAWSNGATVQDISSLIAGDYRLTVTDASGCSAVSGLITVGQPLAPVAITATSVNISCFGGSNGSIDLTVSGGTTGYSYIWTRDGISFGGNTQDLSGLTSGSYAVTVTDANSCTATNTISITQPGTAVSASSTVTNVSCFGGTNGQVILTVGGGTPNYTYSWNGSGGFTATTKDITGRTAGTYNVTITDANGCTFPITNIVITQPNLLAVSSAIPTGINCFGGATGSINATIAGGTTPYSYQWSNGSTVEDPSALIAGNYTLTVTDANGCTAVSGNVTVTQPVAAVSITQTSVDVSCFGGSTGSIDLTVSGGTGVYSYSWTRNGVGFGGNTQDLSSLTVGTYAVTVTDANNCTSTNSVTIVEPSTSISASSVVTNVSCFGGTNGQVILTVAGGTPNYTYSWSGPGGFTATTKDITGRTAGTYNVTITDTKGCTFPITNIVITQPNLLVVSSAIPTNVSCFGGANGSINATISGGTIPQTYQWSNGSTVEDPTGLSAGIYTLTVTDTNGCTATSGPVTVGQPVAPLTITPAITNVACNGASSGAISLTVSGGTASYSYLWSTGATTQNAGSLASGLYTVTVTDANLCTSVQTASIAQPTAISVSEFITAVSCFGGTNGSINLIVSGGVSPYTYAWSGGLAATEDQTNLSAGSYTVTVTDANLCTSTKSITVGQATVLAATGVTDGANCFESSDGSINLTVTGGTSPYQYGWSNGSNVEDPSGLVAGSYTVTVTDFNQCTTTANFTITEPVLLTINETVIPNCDGLNNGSVTLNVSGGTPTYSYVWSGAGAGSNPRTGLGAGEYFVTVTDGNGCTARDSFELIPMVLQVTKVDRTCSLANGRAIAGASGGLEPYSYIWSNGSTASFLENLNTGSYSVTVSAGSCIKTGSVTITVPTNCFPPIARDDNYTTLVNIPVTGTVWPTNPLNPGYDSDPFYALDSLTFENIQPLDPLIGTIVWDSIGGFIYSPAVDYLGTFSLVYETCNPLNLCDTALLIITVNPIDNPIYYPDFGVTYVNVPLTGDVSTNDEQEPGSTYSNPPANPGNPSPCMPVISSNGSYTFVCGTIGVYEFYVPVCEPSPNQNICTPVLLQITVLPLNDPTVGPIANPDYVRTLQNVSVPIPVRDNDKCQNGPGCTLGTPTVITAPLHGTYNTGTGVYTPALNYVGVDSFLYRVCDNQIPSKCAEAWAYITIEQTGFPNITNAMDDYVQTPYNTPVSGNAKTNDIDPEGNTQTVISQNTTIAGKGTLVLATTGVFTFTPEGGFYGPVEYPYSTCDNGTPQACATATIHILVEPSDPIFNPDFGVTYINIPLTGDVSTNDNQTPNSTYSNPPANPGNPSPCMPVISSNGSYTFVCGVVGVYEFYVPVCEPAPSQNICTPVLLQITVLPLNDPQVGPIANPDYVTTLQNVSVSIPVRDNDKCQNGPSCTLGTPTIITAPLHGAYNTGTGVYTPALNYVGVDSFLYRVCDNQVPGKCAEAWAYITIEPTGTANLTNAMDDYVQTPLNTPISGNVKINDTDPEGNTQTVTAQNTTIPGKGTLVLATTGVFTFTPVTGFYGPVDYPYTTCDNGIPQACATATVHILVEPFEPTFNPDFGVTYVNVPLTGDVSTNDSETPGSTYGNPPANPGNPSNCTPVVSNNGSYTFVCGTIGVYEFYVPVCEPAPNQSICTPVLLQITVLPLNDPEVGPIANPDYVTTLQNVSVSIPVRNNDKCQNGPACTLGTPTIITAPLHGTYNTGTGVYAPALNYVGVDSFLYRVCDNQVPSKCADAWAYITIEPTGTANLTNAMDDYAQTPLNTPISGNVKINDSDPEGNTQTVTAQNTTIPGKGTLVLATTGAFTFTPVTGFYGSVDYPYTTCDNGIPQACATATVHILVEPFDPTFNPDFGVTYVDVPLTGDVSTNDNQTPGSTYSNPPANPSNPSNCLPVISSDGSYTFVCGTIGVYEFYVPVCEPAPNQSSCTPVLLQITVLEENDPNAAPIANPDYVTTLQDVNVNIPVRNNDKCQNGPLCTLSTPTIITAPLHGIYTPGTGVYDPDVNFVGIDSFLYQVCDNQVSSKCAQAWAYITIEPTGTGNLTNAMDDYAQTPFNTPVSGNAKTNDTDPEGNVQTVVAQNTTIAGKGTLVLASTGAFTFTPVSGFYGPVDYPYTTCDNGIPQACATATIHILVQPQLCITQNLKVMLEGPYVDNGSNGSTMTTKLNNLGYLPGQKPSTFFGIATPAGQPYSGAPWNYSGAEGAAYNYTPGVPATYKANYPTTTTDWVLVSLRESTTSGSTVCTKAALLLNDGTVQMVSGFDCCNLDLTKTYYVVVEHRNHLIVMSHAKVGIVNNTITYDFTAQQSFKGLLGFGQKLINGKYVMYSGNGQQVISSSADTDINVNDKDLWLLQNGQNSSYYKNDMELNGDVNVQDKNLWLINNGRFSDVPR